MLRLISQIILLFFLIPCIGWANPNAAGFGDVANNLMEPVDILAGFISSISISLGIAFMFAALIKYMQHRDNPLAVPISTVVSLFLMGVALIFIPTAYKLSGNDATVHPLKSSIFN